MLPTEPSEPSTVCKRIRLAIVTTVVCDDNSIYVLDPGQTSALYDGEQVEVRDERTHAWLRALGRSDWLRAWQVAPLVP